jgi:site-specific DNA recombinase
VPNVVAYVRISKDREGLQVGVDRQEQDCRRLAEANGYNLVQIFVDNDVSASTLSRKKRPAYEQMMKLVEAGQVDAILAYSNSRLTRRPLELERLITAYDRTGVRFHTVVSGHDDLSTADGRMIARIKASVDAAESERVGERVRRAQQELREDGRWHGGSVPYGFKPADGKLYPNAEETAVIAEARAALLSGRSLIGIMRELNDRGVTTNRGGRWTSKTMRRVLLRPHPLLDESDHAAVTAILEDPARRTTPGPGRRWLLSGIATCSHCDAPLRGSASSLGQGRKGTYPAYRCMQGKHLIISALALDEYVSSAAIIRIAQPDMQEMLKPANPGERKDVSKLAIEERELRKRMDGLADDISLPERVLQRRTQALQGRLDEISALRVSMARVSPLHVFLGGDPRAVWKGLDLERRRNVVAAVMSVTVSKGTPGIVKRQHRWRPDLPAFDPRRVTVTWADNGSQESGQA